ncbi:MAG TPA: electron transfer flavoprotein subunit beta/FixA family protein [Galbitalea sp.]|jgi:electron transfer flavoprotein beta subunit|nr:electron transfer flavoprotein subunit beta/FixA family protein [Galbitalea sp.]
MRIGVLVKQVPDTWGDRSLDVSNGRMDRDSGDQILDEICERALETALQYKEVNGDVEVVVVSMGPAEATDGLRHALAMGADSALQVLDDELDNADALVTSEALAAVLRPENFDIILAGNISTDGRGGWVPAMIAERLGMPCLGSVDDIDISLGEVRAVRVADAGSYRLRAALPAIVTVTERAPEPRLPGLRGTMGAKRKPLTVRSLAELGISSSEPHSRVQSVTPRPARAPGVIVVDDGDGGTQLAQFLVDQGLG